MAVKVGSTTTVYNSTSTVRTSSTSPSSSTTSVKKSASTTNSASTTSRTSSYSSATAKATSSTSVTYSSSSSTAKVSSTTNATVKATKSNNVSVSSSTTARTSASTTAKTSSTAKISSSSNISSSTTARISSSTTVPTYSYLAHLGGEAHKEIEKTLVSLGYDNGIDGNFIDGLREFKNDNGMYKYDVWEKEVISKLYKESTTLNVSSTTPIIKDDKTNNGEDKEEISGCKNYSEVANDIFVEMSNINSVVIAVPNGMMDKMLSNNPYISKMSYVISGNKLTFRGVMSGSVPGVGSTYNINNAMKNSKVTSLIDDIDDYAKLSKMSHKLSLLGKSLNIFCLATSATTEILDPENETIEEKAGGALTEIGITAGEILVAEGIGMAGAKIGASFGSVGGPVGMVIGAVAGVTVATITDIALDVEVDGTSIRDWMAEGVTDIIVNEEKRIKTMWGLAPTILKKAMEMGGGFLLSFEF